MADNEETMTDDKDRTKTHPDGRDASLSAGELGGLGRDEHGDPLPADGRADCDDNSQPLTEDEVRAAQAGEALDSLYTLCVFAQCGGPEPREKGCGAEHHLFDGQAVMGALQGNLGAILRCRECGEVLRLIPPPRPQAQMVQPVQAAPDAMMSRVMQMVDKRSKRVNPSGPSMGLLGPNGKRVR